MSIRRRPLRKLLAAVMTLYASVSAADVPTAQEDCVQRNLAVCEYPSGLQSTQPGPCPVVSKTIKPQGHEDCSAAALSARAVRVVPTQPALTQSGGGDLAWVGGVERWLIPALIYGGAGCALSWVVWRRRRPRPARASVAPTGALAWMVCGSIGVVAGWRAAGMAFRHAFDSYDNHDSAAPLLLSAPVWLGAFILVSAGVCALLLMAWRRWARRP